MSHEVPEGYVELTNEKHVLRPGIDKWSTAELLHVGHWYDVSGTDAQACQKIIHWLCIDPTYKFICPKDYEPEPGWVQVLDNGHVLLPSVDQFRRLEVNDTGTKTWTKWENVKDDSPITPAIWLLQDPDAKLEFRRPISTEPTKYQKCLDRALIELKQALTYEPEEAYLSAIIAQLEDQIRNAR